MQPARLGRPLILERVGGKKRLTGALRVVGMADEAEDLQRPLLGRSLRNPSKWHGRLLFVCERESPEAQDGESMSLLRLFLGPQISAPPFGTLIRRYWIGALTRELRTGALVRRLRTGTLTLRSKTE